MAISHKKSMKDLGADQFSAQINLFKPPYVMVKVDGTDFELPKALLCYHSKFFDLAFNGKFKEGVEQTMVLEECSKDTFDFAIQWMYTGHAAIPEALVEKQNESLVLLINFLLLADRIDLLGPFDSVVQQIKKLLILNIKLLEPSHVRLAVMLQKGHPLRQLFAQACVSQYLTRLVPGKYNVNTAVSFKFAKELDELEGFASDLMKALGETMGTQRNGSARKYCDPVSGLEFVFCM